MVGVESARVMGTLVCFLRDTERECTYSGVCVCVCVCVHTLQGQTSGQLVHTH